MSECHPRDSAVPLVAVRHLTVDFGGPVDQTRVVDGIGFDIKPGEILGIVGESGSGKSVTSLAMTGLLGSRASIEGSVHFDGEDVLGLDDRALSRFRSRHVGIIFQDPVAALNPVRTIGFHLREALKLHRNVSGATANREAIELLSRVGLPDPAARLKAYPHQLSGGLNQRVMIALALAGRPRLLIADEPTTALDVTFQAQVLQLIRDLQSEYGMAILLITHDLAVVAEMCHRVLVMYAGSIVESGDVADIFSAPRHPYTQALLSALPRLDIDQPELREIRGSMPAPRDIPSGCAFAPRCPRVGEECSVEAPRLAGVEGGGSVACFHPLGESDAS